ncbi:glycosyltransferase family 2 protein [Arthrospiribacter ruber]|uniref:Glycosyltransferase family 2 protein n=1 Tax=Arthrospiribacter ruber TaxID=2487934 RepID=A0A951MAH4_9BACT|nr:glycosyltransferase family A protein [Arthrospiribacter ruber]MBW3466599.1 glycosyltransferase family 2 protein [Arthrospiribacter ruber]
MFSIIIPLYDKATFIRRAIDSVLNQSFKDYEIIVVNDGSTDGGEELVEKFYGNKVKLIQQTNQGVSVARNVGIAEAKNPWIAFLDADDYWHPKYLEFVSKVVSENPNIGIIGTHYDARELEVDPKLQYFHLDNYFRQAIRNTRFFTSATVLRKNFFDNHAGFDPGLSLGEDIDVWLRASLFFGDGVYIQNTLVYYGQEDDYRATQKNHHINNSLIPKLMQAEYYGAAIKDSECTESEFLRFRNQWVLLTLFPFFQKTENKEQMGYIISQIPNKYFPITAFYKLPFEMLSMVFNAPLAVKFFRNYMKFFFRYIYK